MANSMALLLLLILAAVASTTAQLHEKEPLVEPASSTSAELLLEASIAATTAKLQLHEREPHVVEPASTTAHLHEKEPLVEPAASSTSAELLLDLEAALAATTAMLQLHEREPASTTDEPDVFPADEGGYKTYVIELEPPGGGQDADDDAVSAWHRSFLPSATTAQGKPRLLYSYRTVFTGFAARLTEEELKELSAKPGFLRSFEDIILYRA